MTRSNEGERSIVDLRELPAGVWNRLIDDGDVNDPQLVRLILDRSRAGSVAAGGTGSSRSAAVATAERRSTQDDVVRLKVEALNQLAVRLQADGREREAETLLRRSLILAELAYGADAPEVAGLGVVLASALIAQGKFEEAQPHLDRAVARLEPVSVDPYGVASSAYHLAKFLAGRGQVEQATALYERTVALRRQVLGPEHPEVAITLHNLALLYNAAGRVDDARALWAEARALLDGPPGQI